MTITGSADEIYANCIEAMDSVRADIDGDREALKKSYEMRLASEPHKKAWEKAELGLQRATKVYNDLAELARQLRRLTGQATLSAAECALFAYVRDTSIKALDDVHPGRMKP